MKATVIALLICLSFIAADASILGQILNQTKLQGRYNLNTSNGVDLDYNANLVYDNGYVKLDLLNFGGKFNATPEAQNNSADHGAVFKYAGRVHVNQGGHHANVSVLGVAGSKVDIDFAMNSTTNSANITYNQTLFNKNVWAVQADETLAHGAGGAVVHAGGHVQQEGDRVKVHHAAHVNGTVVGGIRHNGTHLGNFTLARASQVVVNQTARTHGFGIPSEHHNHTHHNHSHGNHSHHHNHTRPNVTFGGKALFHDQVVVGWNGQTVGEEKLGEALFGGASWIHHAQDENGTTNGVATAQKALYRYRNRVEQNGQRVAGGHVRGHVGSIHTAGARQWQNGTTDVILGHVGRLSHNAAVRPDGNQTHHNDSISSFEVEALEGGEEFIKGHHGHNGTILAHVGAAWKGGALIRAEPNANGTQVRVHGGSAGRAWGIDSVHRQPWHVAGNRTVNAAFQVAQNVSEINNIDVDVERDSKILNTLNAFERQAQGNKYFRGL